MLRWLPILVAACTLQSREPPAGEAGPVEAVQGLADALRKGDAATAWTLLSLRTQHEADALAAKVRGVSDAGPESGRQMLFTSALPAPPFTARQLSLSGDSAEVQTASDAGTRTWRVVRESGRWRVDLGLAR